MELLDAVKLSLGITHGKLDEEISAAIAAGKADLRRAGVGILDDTDPLAAQAVKLYCKWQYNFQGAADRYERAYAGLRDAMCLCGDYWGGNA